MSAAASSETRQRLVEGRGCAGEGAASRVVLGRKMERLSRFVALCVSLTWRASLLQNETWARVAASAGKEGAGGGAPLTQWAAELQPPAPPPRPSESVGV